MSTYSDLHKKTIKAIEKYNKDIRNIPMENRADSLKLAELTKEFFNSVNSYGLNELNKLFTEDYFNPFIQKILIHLDDQESKRYHESYDYLVALTIEKYGQNELLKSLFSKYAEVEQKPERTNSPFFLKHWFQLLGYWFRKLCGKPNYSLKNEAQSPLNELTILQAINIIKESLKKKPYVKCSVEKNFSSALSLLTAKTKELSTYSSTQNEYDEYDGYKDPNYDYIEKRIAKEPIYAIPQKRPKEPLAKRDSLQEETESNIQQEMIQMQKDLITKNELATLIDQIINKIKEKGFNAKFLVTGESTENKAFRTLATHLNLLNTGNDFINQSFHPYYSKEFLIDEGDKIKLIDFGDQSTYDNKLSQLSEPQTKKLKEELLEELNRLKELCNKTSETLLKDEDQSEISIPGSGQSILITHSSFYQPASTEELPTQTNCSFYSKS